MYTDYCLKFTDAAQCMATLFTEQTQVMGDVVETVQQPKYAAVDVIGTIYKPTGKMLKSKVKGEEPVPEMKPVAGYHANVRHTEPAPELEPFAVVPTNPVRGWA
jgi:hypothetical protein